MAITTKLEATGVAEYKRQMDQAKSAVKSLDAELKLCEAQYNATGDKSAYLQEKTRLLQQQIVEQESAVRAAEEALKRVTTAYGDNSTQAVAWKTKLTQAKTALINMNTELDNVQTAMDTLDQTDLDDVQNSIEDTATDAGDLGDRMSEISGKLDRQAIIDGMTSITESISNAASAAFNFGKNLWGATSGAAEWGESISGLAQAAHVSTDEYQQVEYAAQFFDTTADKIFGARTKLFNAIGDNKFVEVAGQRIETEGRQWLDILLDVTEALGTINDDLERDQAANALFGRGYNEMAGLIAQGRDAFRQTMDEAPIVSADDINNLADANGALKTMNSSLDTLQHRLLAQLAPALEKIAEAVTTLVGQFSAWLDTEEGRTAMENLSQAAVDLAGALTDASFPTILEGIKGAMEAFTQGLGWLAEHKDAVVGAITAIGTAFAGIKIATLGLNIANIANAARNLLGGGAGGATASAAGAAGGEATATATAAGGSSFFSKVGAFLGPAAGPLAGILGAWLIAPGAYERGAREEWQQYQDVIDRVSEISEENRTAQENAAMVIENALNSAQEAGDADMIRQMLFGDEKSFANFATIAPDSGVGALYRRGYTAEDAAEEMSSGMELMQAGREVVEALGELMGEAGEEGAASAADATTAGFVEQISGSLAEYTQAGLAAAQAYAEGFSSGLDINSPSRVMAQLAKFTTAGFVEGIDATLGEVDAAASRMAAAAARPVARGAGTGAGNTYTSSSALYVDKYYQQTDMDVAAISAQLSQAQTRRQRGYGGR